MASGNGPTATPRTAPATPSGPRVPALVAWAFLIAWGATAGGCAAGREPAATVRGPVLYVANGRDGTITRLDAASGRALGAPLPGGEAPWLLAAGPAGALLVLPVGARLGLPGVRLTYVAWGPGGWRARPVPLEPGARAPLLAGGGRYAVVAYQAGGGRGRRAAGGRWSTPPGGAPAPPATSAAGATRSSASRSRTRKARRERAPGETRAPAGCSPTSPSGAAPPRPGTAAAHPAGRPG